MNIPQALKIIGLITAFLILGLCIVGLYYFMSIPQPDKSSNTADRTKTTGEAKPFIITSTNLLCSNTALAADQKPVNTCKGNITVQGEGFSKELMIVNQTKLISNGTPKDLTLLNTLHKNKTPIRYYVTPGFMVLEIIY